MNEKTINIKMMSDTALAYLEKNIDRVTEKIKTSNDNSWIQSEFPEPMFIEKKFQINDFEMMDNPESKDKDVDFKNSVTLYETLKDLPRYVLCDERFWLWLHFEKFYPEVKGMMPIKNKSTILDHWTFKQGKRRGLMFGVLSRMFFRVALSVDETLPDKYELTKWVIENNERFRNLTWRSYSSEPHIVRGALKGEKKALEDSKLNENTSVYPIIGKYVSQIGSVRLLDAISESDIETFVYNKVLQHLKNGEQDK